ncbi:ABC transporter permease [Scleromatobacter humisilvae]|uniref:ABC transporter permease n=1 Tax=Scleromatobacter humisilvae TaxID=2897159 RepID=A0A9X1YKC4_9BURK|nr:ABC transporter permease [Scleromatobacter humisilvae]MCK9687506.1 ABC transporter permease [Scleromatobacter humisilvae]
MRMAQSIWIVFAKELKDALRDRRTLIAVFISSVLMGPLMLVLLSSLVGRYEKRAEAREVVVIGLDGAPTLRNYIERQTFVVKTAPADWETQLKANKLGDPVVVVPAAFEDDLAHGRPPRIELVYSSANSRAQSGAGTIAQLLQGFNQEQTTLRLVARGVAPSTLSVTRIDEHDIADNAARAAQMTNIVPLFVLMSVLYGALNAALDTTAGERERGSLEPLLATPASRAAIVIGKWGAVFALGLLIAVLSCLSFLPAQSLLRSESLAALFRFGWVEAALFIGLLAPLAALIAALMMAVAIRCRTVKEAQANMVVLTMAFTLTPLLGFFTQEGEAAWNLWVPSVAQTTLMDRVLKNAPIGLLDVAPSLLMCVVLTAAALAFVTRQLARRAAQ